MSQTQDSKAVRFLNPLRDEKFPAKVVVVTYESLLKNEDLSESVAAAFGFDGLGLITVSGVPNLTALRQGLLPLAKKFAELPDAAKAKMEDPESFYSVGWSHGKEKMSEGKFDFAKGSFYANPLHDSVVQDAALIKEFPAFLAPNIWPKEDLPELEEAFKLLGRLVIDVGLLIAKQCDTYVSKHCKGYPDKLLYNTVKNSRTPKARLLHYFPLEDSNVESEDFSSWCGWHNDHGSLTGLVPAMYIDSNHNNVPPPSPEAGLYVRGRNGECVHITMPGDHLGFQIGESASIHSGGILQATPHCVRGCPSPKGNPISRETMAVFMEPEWHELMNMPEGTTKEDACRGSSPKYLPKGVPFLASRWNPGQTFGEFSKATFESYY
jgi:isopenicillin N synthase-like dioxygenase